MTTRPLLDLFTPPVGPAPDGPNNRSRPTLGGARRTRTGLALSDPGEPALFTRLA